MKAVVVDKYINDVSEVAVQIKEYPEPKPDFSKNEALIEVKYIGLNFFDILQMQGKYQTLPPFPYVAGCEYVGIVKAVPPKSTIKPGTRVIGMHQGAWAPKTVAPITALQPIPDSIPMDEAAGIYVTYPTAYAGLVNRGALKKGDWCLIHAAAGGVGLSATQIAKALGAKVIACASADKHEVCKKYGHADYTVDFDKKDWEQDVKKITGGKGVDVVLDPIGAIRQSMKCIAWNGRIVVIGFAGGKGIENVPANLILLKNISVTGLFWGAHTTNEPEAIPVVWDALLKLFSEGKLKTVVYDKKFEGLESLPEALQDMWDRKAWGKAVLKIPSDGKL